MANEQERYASTAAFPLIRHDLFKAKAFKPKAGGKEGAPKFRATFVMDPASDDFKAIVRTAKKLAKEKFGERSEDDPPLKWPWTKVEVAQRKSEKNKPGSGAFLDWAKGMVLVVASTGEDYPPELLGIENGDIVTYDDDAKKAKAKGKFYNGVECFFQVNISAFDGGQEGVCCYLDKVLTTNKGTKRGGAGGGASGKEVFSKYVGKISAEDPTDGIDEDDEY